MVRFFDFASDWTVIVMKSVADREMLVVLLV
jgi:hypothetical protein